MFYSIRRLMEELNAAVSEVTEDQSAADDPNIGTFRSVTATRRSSARQVVIIQMVLTFVVIAVCAWSVSREAASEVSIRLAHIGFGVVLGYWFR
jgi:hypothetical protein